MLAQAHAVLLYCAVNQSREGTRRYNSKDGRVPRIEYIY